MAGMFEAGMTVIVDVLELFAGFGSGLVVATEAVLDIGPGVEGRVRLREMVADPALARVPSVHVTVVVPLQLP